MARAGKLMKPHPGVRVYGHEVAGVVLLPQLIDRQALAVLEDQPQTNAPEAGAYSAVPELRSGAFHENAACAS